MDVGKKHSLHRPKGGHCLIYVIRDYGLGRYACRGRIFAPIQLYFTFLSTSILSLRHHHHHHPLISLPLLDTHTLSSSSPSFCSTRHHQTTPLHDRRDPVHVRSSLTAHTRLWNFIVSQSSFHPSILHLYPRTPNSCPHKILYVGRQALSASANSCSSSRFVGSWSLSETVRSNKFLLELPSANDAYYALFHSHVNCFPPTLCHASDLRRHTAGACGKTSLLCSFALGEFPKEYVSFSAFFAPWHLLILFWA